MRTFMNPALCISVASALLASCGDEQLPLGVQHTMPQSHAVTTDIARHSSTGRDYNSAHELRSVRGPLLYVVNFDPAYNDVTIYHAKAKNPSPINSITDGLFEPVGDCIDGHGTLYVTNEPGSSLGWVSVYPAGAVTPSRTITDGVNVPVFCAIDSRGNLWVTNLGSETVAEYKAGSSKPSKVITNGLFGPRGIAIDHSGNMYVANGSDSSPPVSNVVVYAPGQRSPTRTITDGVKTPVGISVDLSGTLYVTNFLQSNVEKFHPGKRHPYETITNGISKPDAVSVGKNGWLYVTNGGANPPTVVEFPPGSLTPSTKQITKGLENPEGTAYSPPLLP